MSLSNNYPALAPNLLLDFANSKVIDSRIGVTRASTATYFDQLGVLQTAQNNVPRIDFNPTTYACNGLLVEEARTNSIRNNTMQGAVAGTPGTLPTNWNTAGVGTLVQEIVGTGTDAGITYVDYRLSGTTSTTAFALLFDATTQIVAASGQTWTSSYYIKLQNGSATNITGFSNQVRGYNGGVLQESNNGTITLTSSLARSTHTFTLANASTTRVINNLLISFASGAAIDITLRIGLPQLEQGAFATSVIPTTTTALTRQADAISMTGTNFSSWFNATAGSLLVQFSIPAQSSATSLATIGDGTANERMIVNAATNRAGTGWRVVDGGVDQCDINITSSFSAGQSVKTIGAYAVNDFAVCQNGGTVGTDVSGTLPTVNALYIGTNGAAAYTNSYIRRISYYPLRNTNAQLQALTGT